MKSLLPKERLLNKSNQILFLGMMICTLLSISFTSFGKDKLNANSSHYFVDKDVKGFPKLKDQVNATVFQLITHGKPGALLINGEWKNAKDIVKFLKPTFQAINSGNAISHINIYGCNFARGSIGEEAVVYLQKELGVSVSASNNITGKDGDWTLEVGQPLAAIAVENYQGNLQCANFGTAPSQDYDCDGVINSSDLDDDNDGILDTVECPTLADPTNVLENGTFTGSLASWNNPSGNWTQQYAPNAANIFKDAAFDNHLTQVVDLSNAQIVGGYYVLTLDLHANNFNNASNNPYYATLDISLGGTKFATFDNPINVNTGTLTGYNGAIVSPTTFPFGSSGSLLFNPFTIQIPVSSVTTPGSALLDFNFNSSGPGTGGDDFAIDNVKIARVSVACDTDGDGIVDSFDLDSDGDGCSDAIEGGYAALLSDLVASTSIPGGNTSVSGSTYTGLVTTPVTSNFGTFVNSTTGVPLKVGTGQTIGTSKNKTINTCKDSDGDSFPDDIDLDDDNDGILDTAECPPAAAYSVYSHHTTSSFDSPDHSTNVPVTINGLTTYTATVNQSVFTSNLTYNGTTWQLVKSGVQPSANNTIDVGISTAGTVGSRVVADAWLVTDGTNYFIQDNVGDNYSKTGSWSPVGYLPIPYYGYNEELTFTEQVQAGIKTANWLFENLPTVTLACDTDGDGIINSLDLDSDADGCPDAIEGTAGFTNTNLVSSVLAGGSTNIKLNLCNTTTCVNANGIPSIAGPLGQAIGSSANQSVQSANCCPAGYSAIAILNNSISNLCPITTADLSNTVTNTCPANSPLEWHTVNTGLSAANKVTDPTQVVAGNYYPVCYNAATNCYSPAPNQGVLVTIDTPCGSAIYLRNVCPATTVNFSTALSLSGSAPAGTVLSWHSGDPATLANKIANPSAVGSGIYYASFYDATNGCFSPVSKIVLTQTSVCPTSNVVTVKSASVTTATVNVPFTFTLAPSNINPLASSGMITIIDTLQAGLTYNTGTGTGWTCSQTGTTASGQAIVSCTTSDVIAGYSAGNPITLNVTPTSTAITGKNILNTAYTSGGGMTGGPYKSGTNTANAGGVTNPTGGVPVIVNGIPNLVTVKTASVIASTPNVPFTYYLTVNNLGVVSSTGTITIIDTLATGLTYNSGSGMGWTCSLIGTTSTGRSIISCTTSSIVAGNTQASPISLSVTPNATAASAPISNTAWTSGGGISGGPYPSGTNTGNAGGPINPGPGVPTTVAVSPELRTVKLASVTNATANVPYNYTLTVNNLTSAASSGLITIKDTLAIGITFNTGSGSNWTCNQTGVTTTGRAIIECTTSQVVAGNGTATPVTLNVTPNATAASSTISNTAWTSGGGMAGGPYPSGTNTGNAGGPTNPGPGTPTTISGIPVELKTVKVASVTSATPNVAYNYSLTVNNVSNSPSSGVITIVDTLATGLTYNTASGTNWVCSQSGITSTGRAIITCTTSSIVAANGTASPVTLNVTPNAVAASSTISNTAWTSGGGMAGGPYPSGTNIGNAGGPNNPGPGTPTTVVGTPDLKTVKIASVTTATPNVPYTYTLTVNNMSSSVASSGVITIKDTLATGLTYNSGTGTGWSCSNIGNTSTGRVIVQCTTSSVVAANGTASPLTLNVTPSASSATGTSILNTAWTSGGGMTGGPYPSGTNTGNAGGPTTPGPGTPTNVAGTPDLKTVKVASVTTATPNVPFTYTLTVNNMSSSVASSGTITIKDTLATGLTYNSGTGTGWTCSNLGTTATGRVIVQCTTSSVVAANGTAAPLTLNVTPSASAATGSTITNTAWTSGGGMTGGPYPSGTNTGNAGGPTTPGPGTPTNVAGTPDLKTVKVASVTTATPNVPYTYTLTVNNMSSSVASSGTITIKDTLATGLTYNSGTGTGWTCSNLGTTATGRVIVQCTTSAVVAANGAAAPVTLNVTPSATAATGTSITNTAWTSGGGMTGGPYPSGTTTANAGSPTTPGSGVPTTVAGTPDLKTVKVASVTTATPNVAYTYTLTVNNMSATVASSGTITIKDTLATGLTYNSGTGTGWTCSNLGTTATGRVIVQCTTSAVVAANGAAAPVTLNVTPSAAAATGTSITNTAWTSGGGMTGGPYPSGTTTANAGSPTTPGSGVPTTVAGTPDLKTVKVASVTTATPNVAYTYTLTVNNMSATVASSGTITIKDTLATGLTYNSGTGTGWTCSNLGTTATGRVIVQCTTSSVVAANGAAAPVTLNVTPSATAATGTSITNTAWTSGGGMTGGPYPSGTTTANAGSPTTPGSGTPTTVSGSPNLVTVKTASVTQASANVPFSYTLTVNNIGTINSIGTITIKDTLAIGVAYNGYNGSGWTCANVGTTATGRSIILCTSSNIIPIGSSAAPLSLTVTPNATAASATISNTAWTSGGGMAGGPYPSGTNTSNAGGSTNPGPGVPTSISGSPELRTAKVASVTTAMANAPFTYTMTVNNITSVASNGLITIKDTLAVGVSYSSASGSGWSCSNIGTTSTGRTIVNCFYSNTIAGNSAAVPVVLTVIPNAAAATATISNTAWTSGGGMNGGPYPSGTNVGNAGGPTNPGPGVPTTVSGSPNLVTVKTASVTQASANVPFSYTLMVNNIGSINSTGTIIIKDTLAIGVTYNGFNGSGWSCVNAGTTATGRTIVSCSSSNIVAAGSTATALSLTVTPNAAAASATIANTAWTSGGGMGGGPYPSGTNTGNAGGPTNPTSPGVPTTVAGSPELRTVKVASVTTATANVPFTYTLTVNNITSIASSGLLTIKDTLAVGVTYSGASGSGWSCSNIGTTSTGRTIVNCFYSNTIAGNSAAVPVVLTVIPNATAATATISNTAWTSGGGMNGGPYPSGTNVGNAGGSTNPGPGVPTTVSGSPNLVTVKTASVTQASANVPFTYTLIVNNIGTINSSGMISIKDTLATGVAYNGYNGAGWSCANIGATATGRIIVSCTTSNTINAGLASVPVVLTVTPNAAAASATIANTAWTSGGGMSGGPYPSGTNTGNAGGPTNPTPGVPTTVSGSPELRTVKTASVTTATVNVPYNYTLTVNNISTIASNGLITVRDTLAAGLAYSNASGASWSCSNIGTTSTGRTIINCFYSNTIFGNSAASPITLTVIPNASAAATTIANTAWTSGGGMAGGPYPSGTNTSNAGGPTNPGPGTPTNVGVNGTPNLVTTKVASVSIATANTPYSYTLVVNNLGTIASTATVTIVDTLAVGVVYAGSNGTSWSCVNAGTTSTGRTVVSCTYTPIITGGATSTSVTLTVTPNATAAAATIKNTAWTSGGGMTGGPYPSGTNTGNAGGPTNPTSIGVPTTVGSCLAGTTAPVTTTATKQNVCPALTASLAGVVSSTCPSTSVLEWHTVNTGLSASNKVANPNAVLAATYYAVCYDATNNCYSGVSNPVTVTITSCLVANPDAATSNPGVAVTINVLTNDKNPDGTLGGLLTQVTIPTIATQPTKGVVTVNPDGTIKYTPNAGVTGTTDSFTYTICDKANPAVCSTNTVNVTIGASLDCKLQAKVFLQGTFLSPSTGSEAVMRDDLRSLNVIPLTEPYSTSGTSRYNRVADAGGQTTTAAVLAATGNDAIVDWVFVELHDAANPATVVMTKACLVQRDGDIVEAADGVSPVTFTGSCGSSYYVAVKHRNHIGAMTAAPIALTPTGTLVDFTTMTAPNTYDKGLVLPDGSLGSYNGSEQVKLPNGKMALWAGNVRNIDNKIKYTGTANDPNVILTQVITYGPNTGALYNYNNYIPTYMTGDVNMDGKVKYTGTTNDSNFILNNVINLYPNNLTNKLFNFDFMVEQIP